MIRVDYNGLIADIRPEDLEAGLSSLRETSEEERAQILESVKSALDDVLACVESKQPLTPKQMQDCANDIGIWFSNEVLEGRAEQYKVALQ